MKHLPTPDFLRDLARRVDGDYDRARLENIAEVVDSMGEAARSSLEPAVEQAPGTVTNVDGFAR